MSEDKEEEVEPLEVKHTGKEKGTVEMMQMVLKKKKQGDK